ncbi:MAG: hypothetical protein P1P83_05295 [Bacteroidales bacterium]|nr:hypothetical protein [Bacteroidales bacterium]MDT8374246.1 hypothetical protein [Bacteroidales bacterium]
MVQLLNLRMMYPNALILGPLFWIIMGVIYTVTVTGFYYWTKDKGIRLNWWKWLLSVLWFTGTNVVIAGAFTLFGENETRAGLYFIGLFGVLFLILGVGLWRILSPR